MAPILLLAPVPDPPQCRRLVGKPPNIHARLPRERFDVVIRGTRMLRMAQNRDLVRRTRPELIELNKKCGLLKHGHGNRCINRYKEAPARKYFADASDGVQKHLHFLHRPPVM